MISSEGPLPQTTGQTLLPGQTMVVVETIEQAQAYLATMQGTGVLIQYPPYPNPTGLYAELLPLGRAIPDLLVIQP